MVEISAQVEIPNRALFKAAEVCELANVQPYVLRSWEAEFPELGVATTSGGARVYRRADVEQVLRIKRLLLVDGLTVAGARRRFQEDAAPLLAETPLDELIGQNARERLADVRRGLRAVLDLLTVGRIGGEDFRLAPPQTSARLRGASAPPDGARQAMGKAAATGKTPAVRKVPKRGLGRGKRSA
jgi:DNA-binding transcriptional MerR regulator